ncbi:aromatic ring-hydroxylating dioxygenase subunit alpha [Lampropedia puyangensis]|uniref:Aromatic ring-hydroxylating dioxygenase subunit alpha n=1 Tax=Lampropedia puyangensis TaxID=1330072 RepID=A0A4S8ES26_9BURK|nr:aromatic ring-hydroxylating dioxygenase subunit alpha [Lampropedia puyangensis]THT96153.1 aromatic ring-hydroxylating dioxygenase subunit alpha [Lampropedia puyangensis]
MTTTQPLLPFDPVDQLLEIGLKDLWYPICPSSFVKEEAVSLRRLGRKLVLWRDATTGKVHALEDHCPHRGAPLSLGVVLGDTIACPYHGVEVCADGHVRKVPGSPGCKLEGSRATRTYPVQERAGAIWVYNASAPDCDNPPPLVLPEELANEEEYGNFLCYVEWKGDWRYVNDNVMDPMHGTFLHKQSHTMFEGDTQAKFAIRDTDAGFVFEKEGQRNVNFDWTEWGDTGTHWMRLEIPYPKTGGPGGNFAIIYGVSPISATLSAVFFWRVRKLPAGWQRDTWRFLYRNRLEARHWAVLEQDRILVEHMEGDANQRESLYQHDMGLVRLRRHLRSLAKQQLRDQETARQPAAAGKATA